MIAAPSVQRCAQKYARSVETGTGNITARHPIVRRAQELISVAACQARRGMRSPASTPSRIPRAGCGRATGSIRSPIGCTGLGGDELAPGARRANARSPASCSAHRGRDVRQASHRPRASRIGQQCTANQCATMAPSRSAIHTCQLGRPTIASNQGVHCGLACRSRWPPPARPPAHLPRVAMRIESARFCHRRHCGAPQELRPAATRWWRKAARGQHRG